MRKCGNCGETGHNRRTCTQLEVIEEVEEDGYLEEEEVVVEKPKKKKKVLKCADCGEEDDHTAKDCPYKPLPEGADIGPKLMECGHFSWWLKDGECELCSRAIFRRTFEVAA
tara:strand:+ start:555 stop:890 length:336 start_codon:yes stop_codon:yes gene_type:complete